MTSIVTPFYNTPEEYFLPFLESVLSQEEADFELVIADDGSGESSRRMLDSIKDPRVKVIHKEHKGISAARNKALEHIQGDTLVFCDSDDELCPGTLAMIDRTFTEHPEAELLVYGWESVKLDGSVHPRPRGNGVLDRDECFRSFCSRKDPRFDPTIVLWHMAVKVDRLGREKLPVFDETLTNYEDGIWIAQILRRVTHTVFKDYTGYRYHHRAQSASHGVEVTERKQRNNFRACNMLLDFVEHELGRKREYYDLMSIYFGHNQSYLKFWIKHPELKAPEDLTAMLWDSILCYWKQLLTHRTTVPWAHLKEMNPFNMLWLWSKARKLS